MRGSYTCPHPCPPSSSKRTHVHSHASPHVTLRKWQPPVVADSLTCAFKSCFTSGLEWLSHFWKTSELPTNHCIQVDILSVCVGVKRPATEFYTYMAKWHDLCQECCFDSQICIFFHAVRKASLGHFQNRVDKAHQMQLSGVTWTYGPVTGNVTSKYRTGSP